MNRKIWIEGLLLVALSLVGLAESLRLIFNKDTQMQYDLLGPGNYVLMVSIGLLVTGLIHIQHHLGEGESIEKEKTSKGMRIRLINSFVACAIYLILIDLIGYATATFVFLMLMFRIVGIKSWPYNFLLSVSLSLVSFMVFAKYCRMVFPRGILF